MDILTAIYLGFSTLAYVGSDIRLYDSNIALRFDNKIELSRFEPRTLGFKPDNLESTVEVKVKINENKLNRELFFVGYEHKCYHVFDRIKTTDNKKDMRWGTNHRLFLEFIH